MFFTIQINVPRCPVCSAILCHTHRRGDTYYFCQDCRALLRCVGNGQSDNEVILSDSMREEITDVEKEQISRQS